jgi:hypothetical protein
VAVALDVARTLAPGGALAYDSRERGDSSPQRPMLRATARFVPRPNRRGPTLRRAFVAALLVVHAWSGGAWADERPSEHAYQTWLAAFAHGSLRGRLWLWTDAHLRLYEDFAPAAAIVRPGLGWQAHPTLYLTGGYGWTPSWQRPDGGLDFTDEHRTWQQVLWTPSDPVTGRGAMIRVRLEQRFRPADGAATGLRLRAMWRGQVPISKAHGLLFVVWNELFVGLNAPAWGQRVVRRIGGRSSALEVRPSSGRGRPAWL